MLWVLGYFLIGLILGSLVFIVDDKYDSGQKEFNSTMAVCLGFVFFWPFMASITLAIILVMIPSYILNEVGNRRIK